MATLSVVFRPNHGQSVPPSGGKRRGPGLAGWPPFQYVGPFDAGGHSYPNIQFQTDLGASEILCDIPTGNGCTAPPLGANFYPFWTLGHGSQIGPESNCQWNFGGVIPGSTIQSFGGPAEYGTPDIALFGGTLIGASKPTAPLWRRRIQ